jgi:hypothetical protein
MNAANSGELERSYLALVNPLSVPKDITRALAAFWEAPTNEVCKFLLNMAHSYTAAQWTFYVHIGLLELAAGRGHNPQLATDGLPLGLVALHIRGAQVGFIDLNMLGQLEEARLFWEQRRRARVEPVIDALLHAAAVIG